MQSLPFPFPDLPPEQVCVEVCWETFLHFQMRGILLLLLLFPRDYQGARYLHSTKLPIGCNAS